MDTRSLKRFILGNKSLKKFLWVILFGLLLVAMLPLFTRLMFFDLPKQSETFDCDDATLFMYERFSNLGITATPIVGDLHVTGEKYEEIDHIWLLVNVAGVNTPVDWGTTWLDGQHREGYPVSYEQLLAYVEYDKLAGSVPGESVLSPDN